MYNIFNYWINTIMYQIQYKFIAFVKGFWGIFLLKMF